MQREKYVVITVPSDNEFYIGKSRISLPEIEERVRSLTSSEDPDKRIVFIKGEPNIHYRALSQLIIHVKNADVSRIEVVPDRRKP